VDGVYKDNRRPETVIFTSSLERDLSRRDFTVNAIAYNRKKGFVDFFGGIEDIENQIISCVGDPVKRFEEDGLRILRALRFASVLNFSIKEDTASAVKYKRWLLANIAVERISAEFSKLLCGGGAEVILAGYTKTVGVFLPEILPMQNFRQNNDHHIYDVLKHTLKVVANVPPRLNLRLAALLHDIAKPQTYSWDGNGVGHFYGHQEKGAEMSWDILTRLRYDNKIRENVCKLVEYHDMKIDCDTVTVKRWLNKIPENVFRDLLLLKRADILAQNPKYLFRLEEIDRLEEILNEILAEKQCFSLKDLAVSGDDIMGLEIGQGSRVGKVLNTLLNMVIDEEIVNNRLVLMETARDLIKNDRV
jgi:tRNA nucleotidyltransferase (CCA-adding enzyme)